MFGQDPVTQFYCQWDHFQEELRHGSDAMNSNVKAFLETISAMPFWLQWREAIQPPANKAFKSQNG